MVFQWGLQLLRFYGFMRICGPGRLLRFYGQMIKLLRNPQPMAQVPPIDPPSPPLTQMRVKNQCGVVGYTEVRARQSLPHGTLRNRAQI